MTPLRAALQKMEINDVAKALYGVPLKTVYRWKDGTRTPPPWLQSLILETLGVAIEKPPERSISVATRNPSDPMGEKIMLIQRDIARLQQMEALCREVAAYAPIPEQSKLSKTESIRRVIAQVREPFTMDDIMPLLPPGITRSDVSLALCRLQDKEVVCMDRGHGRKPSTYRRM